MNYSSHHFRGDGNEYCGLEPTAPSLSINDYQPITQTNNTNSPVYSNRMSSTNAEPENATYEVLPNEGVYEELPGVSNPAYDSEIPILPVNKPSGAIALRPSQNGSYTGLEGGRSSDANPYVIPLGNNQYDYLAPVTARHNSPLPVLPLPKRK